MNNDAVNSPPVLAATPIRKSHATLWIIAAALIALGLKVSVALTTEGTNDVYFFFKFARDLAEHGLEWTYANEIKFNHPPLVAYALRGIYNLSAMPALRANGLTFPFLLRLPGILADFAVVLIMLRLRKQWQLPTWSLVLLALSPVSLMVSGFHGNTDPVVVLFLVGAAYFAAREQPAWCGAALALGCGIKIVPLLLLPAFVVFWAVRKRLPHFAIAFFGMLAAISIQPLLHFPLLFARNVLAYGSYWGIWGVTYWLRMTRWSGFMVMGHTDLSPSETLVMTALKLVIIVAALAIAWRYRAMNERGLFSVIACSWLVFFVFAPGVGAQYLVWLMPFVLVMSPYAFGYVTLASSAFLFFFYNAIAAGLPWNLAISNDRVADQWIPWTIWPWLAFIAALVGEWLRARRRNPSLRLFSLEAIPCDQR